MSIDYDRFERVTTRCVEVGTDPGLPSIIGLLFKETAEAPIQAFLQASTAVDSAMSAFGRENREALDALNKLDGPYRSARSAVLAVLPETVLPSTLKSQPTDTDKLNAIERLVDVIDDHMGKAWADVLLAGDFGQQAPKAVKELNEAIAANKALSKAIGARAAAFGPAYEVYLRFKRVVRDTLGPGSKEYRRIHLRASPGSGGQGGGEEGGNTGSPAGGEGGSAGGSGSGGEGGEAPSPS